MKSAAGKFGMVILKISFRDLPNIRLGLSATQGKIIKERLLDSVRQISDEAVNKTFTSKS